MSGENDEMLQILRAISEGSTAAFDRFYDRYAPFVLHIALKSLGDRMEAEDVCHDVFLEVFHKADRYDPTRGSIESWLAVTTRSRCIDRLRRRSRVCAEAPAGTGYSITDHALEERVLGKLQGEALYEALSKLPGTQRRAVAGMYLESRTQRELSREMQVPLGTVKSFVRYGLHNLRKQLAGLGWSDPSSGGKRHD
jgi:RNA polymerase sigma-70 factor (ECF subfamily)